jgi:SAM-dependent methyltransferase
MSEPRWNAERARHAISVLRYGPNPAATVYESIGTDLFLAVAPGWLNLGLWEGDGTDAGEALVAPRRLVERLAGELPAGGDVLDVGNGLGVQDPVIAEVTGARRLIAVNITLAQLRAGRQHLAAASAHGVNADACRLPFRSRSFDGLISVESAFHFRSRLRFFQEAARVLRPGGVLTMSDIPALRDPRGPWELLAGLAQLRVWGLRLQAVATPDEIARQAEAAGFVDVRCELVGPRTIRPALRVARARVDAQRGRMPRSFELLLRLMLRQVELLWRRGMIDYLLLRAATVEA